VRKGPGHFLPGLSVDLGTTAVTLVFTPCAGLRRIYLNGRKNFALAEAAFRFPPVPVEVATDVLMQNHGVVCGYGQVGARSADFRAGAWPPVVVIDQSGK